MKLANPQWTNTLQWDCCHPGELCLEAPDDYREVVADLTAQETGEEGTLVFSQEGKICALAKEGLLIRDLWSVDVNQKKLLTGVLKQLTAMVQDEYYTEIAELNCRIGELLEHLTQDSMLPLEWDLPSDALPILKAFGVRLEVSEDPFERLVDYVRLSREFLHIHFLVLIGIRSFLSENACDALCRDLSAAGIAVLFVEPSCRSLPENGNRLVIDEDHCELRYP